VEAVNDSDDARKVAADLDQAIGKLSAKSKNMGEKADVSKLERSVADLSERFKDDPRVSREIQNVRQKLDELRG